MKKTILATAITALFATSAQAASIYDKDGTTVDLTGTVQVYAGQPIYDDAGIFIDTADFGFAMGYAVSENLTALGTLSFAADGGEANVDETFVGFEGSWGTVTIGKQYTIFDDAGIGGDYQFGFSNFYDQDTSADQVLKYKYESDMFFAGIAIMNNLGAGADQDGFDANVGVTLDALQLVAYYGDVDNAGSGLNLEVSYALESLTLAAAYSMQDFDDDSESSAIGVTADYTLNDKVMFAAGFASIDADADESLSYQYFLNGTYSFTDSVLAYAEIGSSDADGADFGYVAGMEVSF